MNSEYIRKNELQLVRESTLLAIDRNTEYLLGDEVGRQLSTTALMTLSETSSRSGSVPRITQKITA
jgi:hypothetical protein